MFLGQVSQAAVELTDGAEGSGPGLIFRTLIQAMFHRVSDDGGDALPGLLGRSPKFKISGFMKLNLRSYHVGILMHLYHQSMAHN